jgi:predicted hotdog family 3-hydroxylacyl-ACP dehydratase
MLEAGAQSGAAWVALRRSRESGGGPARIGYLVSAREVVLGRATVPVGAELQATVRLESHAPPLFQYSVCVSVEGEVALRGTIGTYLAP